MLRAIIIITALALIGITAVFCAVLVSDLARFYKRMQRYDALMKEIDELEEKQNTPGA